VGASVAVIIVAAGDSRRLPGPVPKQWQPLLGAPLVAHSFRFFDSLAAVDQMVVAVDAESLRRADRLRHLESRHGKRVHVIAGGACRQMSVWLALQAVDPDPEIVLIHDAARPFPPLEGVEQCIAAAREVGGAILAKPVTETIKRVGPGNAIIGTIERNDLWAAQTPQGFRYQPLAAAYRAHEAELAQFTDDAAIFESNGGRVRAVMGSDCNFKVTTAEDFKRAEAMIAEG